MWGKYSEKHYVNPWNDAHHICKALLPIVYPQWIFMRKFLIRTQSSCSIRWFSEFKVPAVLIMCWCLRTKFQRFSWEYNFNIWNFYFCSKLWESFIPVFAVKSCFSPEGGDGREGGWKGRGSLSQTWLCLLNSNNLLTQTSLSSLSSFWMDCVQQYTDGKHWLI